MSSKRRLSFEEAGLKKRKQDKKDLLKQKEEEKGEKNKEEKGEEEVGKEEEEEEEEEDDIKIVKSVKATTSTKTASGRTKKPIATKESEQDTQPLGGTNRIYFCPIEKKIYYCL